MASGYQIEPGVMQYESGYRQGDKIFQKQGYDHYMEIMKIADGNADNVNNHFKKALTAAGALTGEDFIGTETSAQFIKFLFLDNWARQAFGTFTIRTGMTADIPKDTSDLGPANPDYLSAEITDTLYASASVVRESTDTTATVSVTLRTLMNNIQLSRKFLQYSVLTPQAMETYYREKIVKVLVETEEDAFVNGDIRTGATNINNAYNASTHPHGQSATQNEHLITFDGLRRLAGASLVDVGGANLTLPKVDVAVSKLGKYGINPQNLICLCSIDAKASVIGFSQVETLQTYGPRATILTGEIGNLRGIKLIVTDKMPTTVGFRGNTLTNSTGIRSSSTATNLYTELLITHKDSPILAVPALADNALSLEMEKFPGLDRMHLWAREDIGFAVRYADAIVRIIGILPLS